MLFGVRPHVQAEGYVPCLRQGGWVGQLAAWHAWIARQARSEIVGISLVALYYNSYDSSLSTRYRVCVAAPLGACVEKGWSSLLRSFGDRLGVYGPPNVYGPTVYGPSSYPMWKVLRYSTTRQRGLMPTT